MKIIKPLMMVLALAAIGFGVFFLLFPPAEKVIRKRLATLAGVISARPEGNISTIANVNRIAGFFHPEVSLNLEGFGREVSSVNSRAELQQLALAARQRATVSVQFHNVGVEVGPEKTNATATATALVKVDDDPNAIIQDLLFEFEKVERDWLIRSVARGKPPSLE